MPEDYTAGLRALAIDGQDAPTPRPLDPALRALIDWAGGCFGSEPEAGTRFAGLVASGEGVVLPGPTGERLEQVQLKDNVRVAARLGRTMDRRWPRSMLALAGIAVLAVAACGTYRPQDVKAGMDESEVAALIGRPAGHYPGPNGQTRVEVATGPYGRVTWMIDLDASGKVIDAPKQVLNEAHFGWIQQNARDHDSKWLLYNLGRPGEVMRLGWIGGQVWSWRYPTFDCLWFQVTVNDDGSLRDAGGYGIDPHCDVRSEGVRGIGVRP